MRRLDAGGTESHHATQRGQALVEFALVLPLLLLLVFGLIEFGRILNAYLIVTHAAREGARFAVVHPVVEDVQDHVIDITPTLPLTPDDVTVVFMVVSEGELVPTDEPRAQQPVQVRVRYNLPLITPIIRDIVGDTLTVKSDMMTQLMEMEP